jgi:toxin ParE1/3/4
VTAKPLVSSNDAKGDVAQIIRYYTLEAGVDVADAFVAELEAANDKISASPVHGSPRYATMLNIPDLRHRKLRRFPYLVFYAERDDRIEVMRVLHAARDIPAWLGEPGSND